MRLLRINIIGLSFIASIGLYSCGAGAGNTGSEDSTFGEKVEAVTENVTDAFDGNPNQRFVNDAVNLNVKELAWLNAGVEKGTDPELKKEAKSMIRDHEKMGADIKAYAVRKSLEVPAVDTKDEVDIKEDKGREWDRKWIDKMVSEHEDAIDELENAQAKVDDAELKTIIDDALPKLKGHLEAVRKLQAKLTK